MAVLALLLVGLAAHAQPPADPKPADGERVILTPQEYQKLLDTVQQLKKELAARKPAAPSGCAVRGRVEKRGEQLVAAIKLTYTFRTALPNTAVALGGRRAFAVGAALDGAKLPVLETADDGFAALVETAGEHTLTLDLEAPVTARGQKAEIGFEFGLPKSPITTLTLEPPADVKRLVVVTKTGDGPKPADPRRAAVEAKQLAPKGGDAGLPLGPVESLEVLWEPPAAVVQPVDLVQSAELDIGVVLNEASTETTAKIRLRGPGREWRLVAPPLTDVSVERLAVLGEVGPLQPPQVTKPADPNKPVWKIELPPGSTGGDWLVTAVVRQPRPKSGAKGAPVPVGPFAVLDVLKQTGTVTVKAGPNTRFAFKHGPDLRRVEVPAADDDTSTAQFRLATGPTGSTAAPAPLLAVEAAPVEGAVRVRPAYKLTLTEPGWRVRAELAFKPIRTEVEVVTVEVPAEWRGLESEFDPEVVQGVSVAKADGPWAAVTVRLAKPSKQPFTVALLGTVPTDAGARTATVPFPRYPRSVERDAGVTATVPDGLELRGTARGWEGDQPSPIGVPLAPADAKAGRTVSAVGGRSELGLARVKLDWGPYRPDLSAEVRADVTVGERQFVVSQAVKVRAADGFPKPVRFRAPPGAVGVKMVPALESIAPGVWSFSPPAEAKEAAVRFTFALPLPADPAGPVSVPVGLFWAADVTRSEVGVRVWAGAAGRTVAHTGTGWRELPPEVAPDRDTLPLLTLTASGEHDLALEVRRTDPDSAAAVWVERALIEAGTTEDGAVGYRARFRLARWLAPDVEVWLPPVSGANPVARLDGVGAALVPAGESDGGRLFRVALPEPGSGRAVVLELRYATAGSRQALGETAYQPPRLPGAAYSGPVRWRVAEAGGSAPLLLGGGRAELRWRWRGPMLAPSAAPRADLERWFASGNDLDSDAANQEGEPLVVRQLRPEPVRVARVPWVALVIGSSLAVCLVVLALSWVGPTAAGVGLTLLSGTVAVGVVLYPQPVAQAVAAGQPGLSLGLVLLIVQAMVRWTARRRARYLPGFTRTPPAPTTTAAPSARSRPGSGGPPAPVGSGA